MDRSNGSLSGRQDRPRGSAGTHGVATHALASRFSRRSRAMYSRGRNSETTHVSTAGTAEELLPSRASKRVARAKKAVVRKPSISLRSRVTKPTHRIPRICGESDPDLRRVLEFAIVSPSCGPAGALVGMGSGLALTAHGKAAWEAGLRDQSAVLQPRVPTRLDTIMGVVYRSASRSAQEVRREENLSAAQQEPQAHPRVPRPHEDPRRPRRDAAPTCQGSPETVGHHREEVAVAVDRARFQLPRACRLRKRRQFVAVQTTGRKVHTKYFLVLVAKEGTGRVGITVTKRTGNAVTRNRLKRVVREYVRQARWDGGGWVPQGRDLVIVAKASAAEAKHAELVGDLERSGAKVAAC